MNSSFQEPTAEWRHLESMFFTLTRYIWIIIPCVGLPGNVMCIVVALQKDNRKVSTCAYMVGLACADSLSLGENLWCYNVIFLAQPSESEMQ
jgi:hypothetical protein